MEDAERRYAKRLTLGLLAYVVILAVSVPLTSAFPGAVWRFPVAITPMAAFIYMIVAYVRYLRSVDELQQRINLEALAIAFGATAAFTFCYGFLEHVGLPHINWWWVWPVMAASWILANRYAKRRYK